MSGSDWIYGIISGYLIFMGITGINLNIIWITLTFKIKVYDFEYLYGRTAARILFIFLGGLLLLFHFVIMRSLMDSLAMF